jgi:hypothetical protein
VRHGTHIHGKGNPIVDNNGWGIAHGWCDKQGVEFVVVPCEGEKIGQGKMKRMRMILKR